MSWVLGIDTSSAELSLGLVYNGKPFLSINRYIKNSHAEHITDIVKYTLRSADISSQDISHVVVSTGPGSFTGLRIGVSFLKGLFLTHNTKALALSSMTTLAASLHHTDCTILSAMDGRQGNIFCEGFKKEGTSLSTTLEKARISVEEFYNFIPSFDYVITDTVSNDKSTVFNDIKQNHYSTDVYPLQKGLTAALLGARSIDDTAVTWDLVDNINPEYMQLSYAEQVKSQAK